MALPRKPLRIRGEHALVTELTRKRSQAEFGRKSVVARLKTRRHLPTYSLGMTIAHLIYPLHFPEQLASRTNQKMDYSARIPLTKKSQKEIGQFYVNRGGTTNQKSRKTLADRIYAESGILVNFTGPNAGISKKGNLVFFEVDHVAIWKPWLFIKKMPAGLRKKQALLLLTELQNHRNSLGEVDTHTDPIDPLME
ncbi:MAG: hypothetical protein HY917_02970 [Candidatus Diapherotrites archaeon]|nr:hypothetical protein [Candidatus Diapherotrites archaeon]